MTHLISGCAKHVLHHLGGAGSCKAIWLILSPLAILFTAVMFISGCRDNHQKQATPSRPVLYVIAPSASADMPFIQTGEIRAHDEVTLGFRLDGRMSGRTVDVGDSVHAGQVIATLDSDTSQNQFFSAKADLASAQAAERTASLNLQRMKQLMPLGAIARAQYDTAQSDWQAATSRRQSAEAALKNAQDNLSWTRLTVPQSGVITGVNASPGQVLSTGQAVVTLAVSGTRDAVFDLADPQLVVSNKYTPFTLSLLSTPSVRTTGHLRDISPQADPQTRTWRVRVTLDAPPDAMALGASVLGELPLAGKPVIMLPATALTRQGNQPAVFVVDRHTLKLQLRPVSLVRFTSSEIFISGDVSPGEAVVTAGVSKLRQGEKVLLGEDRQ
ncbi:UNVERIFIED_ORG: RND family efflux transporter MFP subunit [Rahnella aquatilis]